MGINGNNAEEKAEKETIGMSGIATIILSYTGYYPAIRKERKLNTIISKLNNIKPYIKEREHPKQLQAM